LTLFKKSRGRQDDTLNSQEIPANSSSSLHDKIISNVLYTTINLPQASFKSTTNAVDQAMDLLLSRPTNTRENHLIINLKPRISANTTFTTKKNLKFAREDCFMLRFFWVKPNDYTNKLRILLSVKDFANHAKFVFFVASVSCLQVCNCNKRIKTICQGTYLLSRATYIAKCCWRAAKI